MGNPRGVRVGVVSPSRAPSSTGQGKMRPKTQQCVMKRKSNQTQTRDQNPTTIRFLFVDLLKRVRIKYLKHGA
jgi:hypothetical protein